MRTQRNPLARLDQAAKAAEVVLAEREAARSEERRALLRIWNARQATEEGITGEEEDFRLLVSVEENIYQYELKHGPLAAVFIPEDDPLLSSEDLRAIPDTVLFGYCKGIVQSGWKPNWEARAEWLALQEQNAEKEQAAGERQ